MKRRIWFYGSILLAFALFAIYATAMPGTSHRGALPALSAEDSALASQLAKHVTVLAQTIGERRIGHGDSLDRAKSYVLSAVEPIAARGRGQLRLEDVGAEGSNASNVILEFPGESTELVIVGAHYDSAPGTPGADDNASGTAAAIELAARLSDRRLSKTVRFVFFANEEPPYFQKPGMGSLVHARGCRDRGEKIEAMLSLESIGYYSDAPGTQRYPWPLSWVYPSQGNFVGFVGNLGSRSLVRRAVAIFRESVAFPSEGAALPARIPGVGWSDQWAFWQFDYPAIMVTGTAIYRDPHYHEATDVPANVDASRLARVTVGLEKVIERLASGAASN